MPHLEDWSIHLMNAVNAYTAPELYTYTVRGTVTDHKTIPDGSYVYTSRMKEIDYVGMTVKTKNTLYTLGKPNSEWNDWREEQGLPRISIS